jgi:hypothetical protein
MPGSREGLIEVRIKLAQISSVRMGACRCVAVSAVLARLPAPHGSAQPRVHTHNGGDGRLPWRASCTFKTRSGVILLAPKPGGYACTRPGRHLLPLSTRARQIRQEVSGVQGLSAPRAAVL